MGSPSIVINKKPKPVSKIELECLTKEQLIDRIIQLELHNTQLKNILQKTISNKKKHSKQYSNRPFDFSKAYKRHVLLRLSYFGWDNHGFACQEDSTSTIEYHLFKALKRTCLIESRDNSNYHRCGRTDKEVSAFCQVISIDLRSKYSEEKQMDEICIQNELDYCKMLNKILPKNIRCLYWMPIKNKFYSSRFDCGQRTYRYFFPKGNLNIEAMRKGCEYLKGIHDYRNLCKMDVGNGVISFIRNVIFADINSCKTKSNSCSGYSMFYFTITSEAFLWHQIRCIMAILILIGQEKEDPGIIRELLNVEENPCKPQYTLASGIPLNLYSCEFKESSSKKVVDDNLVDNFDEDLTKWIYDKENLGKIIEELQSQWTISNIKTSMIRSVIEDIQSLYLSQCGGVEIKQQANSLMEGVRQKQYEKLLLRKKCGSLQDKINHYIKKQRICVKETESNFEIK